MKKRFTEQQIAFAATGRFGRHGGCLRSRENCNGLKEVDYTRVYQRPHQNQSRQVSRKIRISSKTAPPSHK